VKPFFSLLFVQNSNEELNLSQHSSSTGKDEILKNKILKVKVEILKILEIL